MFEKKRFFLILFMFLCIFSSIHASAHASPLENQQQEQPFDSDGEFTEESCGEEALPGFAPELVNVSIENDFPPEEFGKTLSESSVETPPPEL